MKDNQFNMIRQWKAYIGPAGLIHYLEGIDLRTNKIPLI